MYCLGIPAIVLFLKVSLCSDGRRSETPPTDVNTFQRRTAPMRDSMKVLFNGGRGWSFGRQNDVNRNWCVLDSFYLYNNKILKNV